jgi:hypothetical protein
MPNFEKIRSSCEMPQLQIMAVASPRNHLYSAAEFFCFQARPLRDEFPKKSRADWSSRQRGFLDHSRTGYKVAAMLLLEYHAAHLDVHPARASA